jgi:hypothetical protein
MFSFLYNQFLTNLCYDSFYSLNLQEYIKKVQ